MRLFTVEYSVVCRRSKFCAVWYYTSFFSSIIRLKAGFVRVLENLESPGILLWHFQGLESHGKRPVVLESSGNLFNSTKKYEVYGRQ